MFSKTTIVMAVAGALALVSVASADPTTQPVVTYVGGHNAIDLVQARPRVYVLAPYALTGEKQIQPAARRFETIWVGQRFAGLKPAN